MDDLISSSDEGDEFYDLEDDPRFPDDLKHPNDPAFKHSSHNSDMTNGDRKTSANNSAQNLENPCNGSIEDQFQDCCSVEPDEDDKDDSQDPTSTKSATDIIDDELQLREEAESRLSEDEIEERRQEAEEMKNAGNDLFRENKFSECVTKYTDALALCPLCCKKQRSILLANRAAAHMKLDAKESALSDCDRALELDPTYLKCLVRRAEIREAMEKLQEALDDYQQILQLDPGNQKARVSCMTLPDRIKAQQEKLKEEMLGQLKQLGNMVLKPFGLSTDNFKMVQDPATGGYSVNFGK